MPSSSQKTMFKNRSLVKVADVQHIKKCCSFPIKKLHFGKPKVGKAQASLINVVKL